MDPQRALFAMSAANSAREKVLAAVKARMPKTDVKTREVAVAARLADPHANLIPARGQGDDHHRIAVFSKYMEDVGGTVEVLEDLNDVPMSAPLAMSAISLPPATCSRTTWSTLIRSPAAVSRKRLGDCGTLTARSLPASARVAAG